MNKALALISDWLNDVEQTIKRDQGDRPFSDFSEKKTMYDKFKLLLTDVLQHSDMVRISVICLEARFTREKRIYWRFVISRCND